MQYFIEQASTHREAEAKVRQKYGDRARIMSHKTVRMGGFLGLFSREGVEVTGYFSDEPVRREPPKRSVDVEEEKKKILGTVKNDKTIETVLKELQELRETLAGEDRAARAAPPVQQNHPTIERIIELLRHNEFVPEYIDAMVARVRNEFSFEQLEDFELVERQVVRWIGDSITLLPFDTKHKPKIMVLVGPTGVGKTTSIAKLAAIYGIQGVNGIISDVRVITIDNYRIGAKEQIETYGHIMNIPVTCVETFDELRKQVALYRDVDVIFIDTVGKSPRDFANLGKMNSLLQGCGGAGEVHLALSATTKTSDLQQIVRQFESFGTAAAVITKLDETTRVGNVISVLHQNRKPISFITDGQGVPQDIEPASIPRLLINLEGFTVDREDIEQRFAESRATENQSG